MGLVGILRTNSKQEDISGRRDARARRGSGSVPDASNDAGAVISLYPVDVSQRYAP
jgi:hypothetical protein